MEISEDEYQDRLKSYSDAKTIWDLRDSIIQEGGRMGKLMEELKAFEIKEYKRNKKREEEKAEAETRMKEESFIAISPSSDKKQSLNEIRDLFKGHLICALFAIEMKFEPKTRDDLKDSIMKYLFKNCSYLDEKFYSRFSHDENFREDVMNYLTIEFMNVYPTED